MCHQAKNCPLMKPQITTAAATIQQGSQPPARNTCNEIPSAAQSFKISKKFSRKPKTKESSATPILDSSAEHLLVTTEIAGNLAKTLVVQQTAGANMVSRKFCTFHNLILHPLQTPSTLQMPMKGSKGSISHCAKAFID